MSSFFFAATPCEHSEVYRGKLPVMWHSFLLRIHSWNLQHEVEKLSGPLTGSRGLQREVGVFCQEKTVNLKHKCITILQSQKRLLSLQCMQHLHIRNLSQMHLFLFRFRSTWAQRRVQLHCIFFSFDASNHVDLTQWATTEKNAHRQPKDMNLEKMQITSTLPIALTVSNFCCRSSAVMQLWIRVWKSEFLRVWVQPERAIFLCACTCKFPWGYAYCSQELVQTRFAASPHLFSLSQAHRLNFFTWPDWKSEVTVAPNHHTYRPNAVCLSLDLTRMVFVHSVWLLDYGVCHVLFLKVKQFYCHYTNLQQTCKIRWKLILNCNDWACRYFGPLWLRGSVAYMIPLRIEWSDNGGKK